MYRALITDLDGTVVAIASDGSDVRDSSREHVQQAEALGRKIASATGRSWHLAKPVITKLGITSPCIIEGGTRIIDPVSEQTLWQKSLAASAVAEVIAICKNHTLNGMLLTHDKEFQAPLREVKTGPSAARIMYLLGIADSEARAICEDINSRRLAAAHTTISWDGGGTIDVHVTHTEATKQHAVGVWQELEGVTQAETIGMGDSGNDLPLFLASGLKVAVANATDELKAEADYIAPAQADNALEHVISKFLLNK